MSLTYDPDDDGHLPSDYDDYEPLDDSLGPDDDYDPYLDDPDDEARAEDPPEGYLEAEAWREHEHHCDLVHGGGECDCPPEWPELPPHRRLDWLPRWSRRNGWSCGTPSLCSVRDYPTPWAAWRAHRLFHTAPF